MEKVLISIINCLCIIGAFCCFGERHVPLIRYHRIAQWLFRLSLMSYLLAGCAFFLSIPIHLFEYRVESDEVVRYFFPMGVVCMILAVLYFVYCRIIGKLREND